MKKTGRKIYSREFKEQAVQLLNTGSRPHPVAGGAIVIDGVSTEVGFVADGFDAGLGGDGLVVARHDRDGAGRDR